MPMVSATDIPLQPYPTGRTSPQAPSDYQQIPTSPQMFGSIEAEALQGAGQQGEKLATEVARIGAYQQHYLDRTEEDKLSSQLDDAAHQRKYGDPTAGLDANGNPLVPGFKNRYGSDAIDYIKSGQPSKDFNDDVARIAASASNDRVREMFLRQSRARRAAFDNSLDEHWTSQLAAYNDQVRKETNIGIDRDLAVGYNDDQIVQNKIHDKIALYVRDEKDPVIAGGKYFLAVHDGAKQLIDAALADNNPTRAAEIFNAYKDHMSGSDQISLWNSIHPVLDNQTIAGAILGTALRQPGGGTGGFRAPAGAPIEGANPDEQRFLNEARFRESTNRYDLIHPPTKDGEVAGGAYGFLPGTWKEATTATGIGTEFPTADKAPAKVQDANALWLYRKYGTKPWAGSGPYGETEPLEADFAKRSGAFGTPAEAAKNLTTVAAPGGASFTVHKLAAPQIQGFLKELEGFGYRIDPTTSGAYNDRNKVGVGSVEKSEHAYGSAFDINWNRNKQADQLITDLPKNVSEIAAKWGLKWGGDFRGKKDAMHFEVARLLPGIAAARAPGALAAKPPGMIAPGNINPLAVED